MNDEYIARFSNNWILILRTYPQSHGGMIAVRRECDYNDVASFSFRFHPKTNRRLYRMRKALYCASGGSYSAEEFDSQFRSLSEAIRLGYEYVLKALEEERQAQENIEEAKHYVEEARAAGKMFQMADETLQRCLTGESK